MAKMPIATFVKELQAAVARKDGYIMGATGQNPRKWATTSWWFTQYKSTAQKDKALYWRAYAERVWDCNGMAEGLYKDYTGVNINTKARYNYAQWCDPKGTGLIPTKYRVPGAAVFWGDTASAIHHVGYLEKPVDANNPGGDWYIIEARGVTYGVVRTKLNSRKPNFWGWMTKYFDYDADVKVPTKVNLGDRTLRKGDEGEDVKALQANLIKLGINCGKYGADGDFGSATEAAVEEFQKRNGLTVDGVYGPKSHAAMEKAIGSDSAKVVKIKGGNCYVRTLPNTTGKQLGVARSGETHPYAGETADNGWNKIVFNGKEGWVSGKYSEVTTNG